MMKKRTLLMLSAAGLLAGGLALAAGDMKGPGADDAAACPHHDRHGMPMGGPGMGMGMGMMHNPEMMLGRMGDELKLTEEQRTRIRGILDASRTDMDKLHEEMRSERERLAGANPDDKGYDGTVSRSARRIGELTTQMIERSGAVRAKVHAVLTPEQRAEAEKMKARMMERCKEHRGQPGGAMPRHRGMMQGDGPPPPPPADDGGTT